MLLERKISITNILQMVLFFTIILTLWTHIIETVTAFEFGCIKRFIKYKIRKNLKTKLQ